MTIEDDDRRSAGERLALFAFVGLMVGLLITMGHNVRTAHQSAATETQHAVDAARQLAISDELVTQLTTERDLIMQERRQLMHQIDFLAAGPTERIIVQPCDPDRPTPAFSRDSQFPGSTP